MNTVKVNNVSNKLGMKLGMLTDGTATTIETRGKKEKGGVNIIERRITP